MLYVPWLRQVLPAREMPTWLYSGVLLSALFEVAWLAIVVVMQIDPTGFSSPPSVHVGPTRFAADGPVAIVMLGAMVAITWGCRNGQFWARYAAIAFWLAPVAALSLPPTTTGEWAALTQGVAFAAMVAAYLFRNEAVQSFFERSAALRSQAKAKDSPKRASRPV